MSSTLMTAPAAGWYHDPADAALWRWWDGSTWTDHVRADESATPVVPAPQPVAVDPAPSAGPARLDPAQFDGIPQPGQVAAAPVAAGGPVSTTPDIPVTDQMYWHSSSAEVIEVPRLPHHTVSAEVGHGGSGKRVPGYVRDWQDLGSPQTAGIWLLAAMPLLVLPISLGMFIAFSMAGLPDEIRAIATISVIVGLSWVFAYFDSRSLGNRGYHAPSIGWMLILPPLLYFVARGRAVRREGRRAWPPELLFFPVVLVGVVISVIAVLPLLSAITIG